MNKPTPETHQEYSLDEKQVKRAEKIIGNRTAAARFYIYTPIAMDGSFFLGGYSLIFERLFIVQITAAQAFSL